MAARGQGGFDSNAGTKVGLEIWRIENMNPVRCKDPAGTFYTGDAYIILNTKQVNNALAWDLHFWLGSECSQDEYGSAALRTVELDDQLGGGPVQFREVDGHESQAFKGLFKDGLTLKSGGVASAFNKVERDSWPTRLFHLKGKRQVRCQQVKLDAASMNEGDVFILDMGLKMYQWNGKDANKYEKFKGLEMMKKINDSERGGRAEQVFLESGKDDNEDFWKGVGVSSGKKPSIAAATDDSAANTSKPPALFQISDASGSLEMKEVARGSLEHSMLDEKDVFLVDSGSVIYVWVGKGASKDERRKSMEYATKYMADNNIENWTPCNRVPMNGETPAFKSLFKNWPEPKSKNAGAAPAAKKGPDTTQLYGRNKKEEEKMYSLEGKVEVWRVNNFKREAMDPSLYGQFWAGDSFIVLYSYTVNTKPAWIIYFWQGRDSTTDEKGASALIAKEMDDELGGDPVQVRVVQNKEPKHFLALFKGKMIVHEGGVASGFKNIKAEDSFDTDGVSLFHVKGTNSFNTRAVQVAEKAAQLNSGDCFVLLTPKTTYEWYGQYANQEEKDSCSNVAKIISAKQGGSTTKVEEGKEDDHFWEVLGGKAEYPTDKPVETEDHEPRLFQMSCNIGHFNVEEIFDFVQDDLIDDDIMMLDVFSEVYVWVGREASRQEKDQALTTAMDYIKNAPDGRSPDTPVFRVSSGFEPPNFTQWFLGWDATKTKTPGEDPYLQALAAKGVAVGKGGLAAVSASMVGFAKPSDKYYSLDDLKNNNGLDNVDPKNKHLYLSDGDFEAAFGMDKTKFDGQAKWKKDAAKKKLGIF